MRSGMHVIGQVLTLDRWHVLGSWLCCAGGAPWLPWTSRPRMRPEGLANHALVVEPPKERVAEGELLALHDIKVGHGHADEWIRHYVDPIIFDGYGL